MHSQSLNYIEACCSLHGANLLHDVKSAHELRLHPFSTIRNFISLLGESEAVDTMICLPVTMGDVNMWTCHQIYDFCIAAVSFD